MIKKQELVIYLQKKYSPEIILLGGSRAKNTQRKDSDWDLYLIGDYKIENEQISEEYQDEYLDIALFPKSCLKNKILKLFYGPVNNLKILLDNTDNFGLQIIKGTKKAYLNKPKPLTQKLILDKINHLNRIISKVEGYKNQPEANFFHLAQFYQIIIPFWFELHGEWSVPVQYAIPIIKSRDTKFYKLLKLITTTTDIKKQLIACKKILNYINK